MKLNAGLTCLGALAAAAMLTTTVPAHGVTITIPAFDAGFVTEMGGSAKGDGTISPATYNYSVGREEHYGDGALGSPLGYMERKNYLAFDLSAVTGPITSATLSIYMGPDTAPAFPGPGGEHGYESLDPTETFEILETTDPGSVLAMMGDLAFLNTLGPTAFDSPGDPGVMVGKDLFLKLGDGPLVLASKVVSAADDDTTLTIPITPGGLGYLSGFAGGPMVLAGTLPSAPPPPPADVESQLIFGFTGPFIPGGDPLTPTLEITFVPEPATLGLLLPAFALTLRRRSR
jgi:hypothetical protein